MTHAESFSQCASYRNYWRYYIWPLFIFKWKWNMPKQLTYTQFVNKLNKGDLKTLEIQPEQNVYMVSGKTKKDEDYSSTILYNNEKDLQKSQIQLRNKIILNLQLKKKKTKCIR